MLKLLRDLFAEVKAQPECETLWLRESVCLKTMCEHDVNRTVAMGRYVTQQLKRRKLTPNRIEVRVFRVLCADDGTLSKKIIARSTFTLQAGKIMPYKPNRKQPLATCNMSSKRFKNWGKKGGDETS